MKIEKYVSPGNIMYRFYTHIEAASDFDIRVHGQRKKSLGDNETVCPRAIDVNRYEIAVLYAARWMKITSKQ